MTEEQIKHMVNRFLNWKLPKDFNPDCGISFDRKYQDDHSPVGTNLLDASQADAMVRHMVEGLSAGSEMTKEQEDAIYSAYLGLCRAVDLTVGAQRAVLLLKELFPFIRERGGRD